MHCADACPLREQRLSIKKNERELEDKAASVRHILEVRRKVSTLMTLRVFHRQCRALIQSRWAD